MSMELSILPTVDKRPAGACRRRDILVVAALFSAVVYSAIACRTATAEPGDGAGRNVLFIAVGRSCGPSWVATAADEIQSPNIDRLAARGTVFVRAYCQQAVCSPSRTSLMTGLRPDSTRVYESDDPLSRQPCPMWSRCRSISRTTATHAERMGKIYHGGLDDTPSWSEPSPKRGRPMYAMTGESGAWIACKARAAAGKKIGYAQPTVQRDGRAAPTNGPTCPTTPTRTARWPMRRSSMLRRPRTSRSSWPWGFSSRTCRSSLPRNTGTCTTRREIQLAANPVSAREMPRRIALTSWGEMRALRRIPRQGPLDRRTGAAPDSRLLRLRQLHRRPGRPRAGRTGAAWACARRR